ncbi:uncharacterized protein [Paramisgurnus dabryanus]|uniref:uncharacterized protein isoform X2 n=1 Tax=Paramisgurnus dabryanus TaxID=90735 RepID=UPI0031F417CB
MFALPGAVAGDECSPEGHGLVTGSGTRDVQRRLSNTIPTASHIFALPGAVEDEEWSSEAYGLMIGSGERGAQQRLSVSSSAADRESIVSSGASVHHTIDTVERSTVEQKKKGKEGKIKARMAAIRSFLRKSGQSIIQTFCVCHNEEDLDPSDPPDPSDPQPGPSGLEPCARRDHADLLKPTGYHEPDYCLSGSYTLDKTEIQEETGPKHDGPFDQELRAQPDQTSSQSCLFGLQRAREDNRQYSPFGLESTSYEGQNKCLFRSLNTLDTTDIQEETGPKHDGPFDLELRAQPDQTSSQSCLFGLQRAREDNRQYSPFGLESTSYEGRNKCLFRSLNTLDTTDIQEETGPKHDGPFDQELRAQPDQTSSQSCLFGLQRTREDNRQYSPFGLEPASCNSPVKCLSGSCSLDTTEIQEETGPKNDGPFDQEPHAQPDQTTSQPGPSGLQRAREDNLQYSPFGVEPTSYKTPVFCQTSLFTSKQTDRQGPAKPEHHPCSEQEKSDEAEADPEPSDLQLNYRPGRIFKLHYEMGRHIGRGAFGNVYEGRRLSDNKKVAIKTIDKSFRNRYIELPDHKSDLLAEVAINLLLLKPKKSPHIVEMLDWFTEDHEHILVLEYPDPCVTLTKFIRDNGCLSEELARDFMRQAILGAKDCFRRGVYHGDIKLDNILINTDTMKLKLIDFGVSQLTEACTVYGVDKRKQGPCVAKTICSFGVLLYKMLHGDELSKPYYEFTKSYRSRSSSKEFEEFMDLCFQNYKRGRKRKPKLDDLLKHPWMMKK